MEEEKGKEEVIGKKRTFTAYDYYYVFSLNKKKILFWILFSGLISIIVAFFVMTPVYYSSATLKTSSKGTGLSGLLSSSGLPGLGDFGDLTEGAGSSQELALFENILQSRKNVEQTMLKFNLFDQYGYKYTEDAIKYFREEIMVINKDKVAGVINIGIFDENPQKAKEITEFLIGQLNQINIELNVQSAKNNREYIQERYNIVQKDLQNAEDSLRFYQDIYGISPDIQIQAATKTVLELEAQIKSEEVKLDILKKILSPDQAEVKTQEEKLSSLNKQLAEMQTSEYDAAGLNLKGGPQVAINFLRLKRNVEIQNKILTTLVPLYEQAKIEENRNTPTVIVMDPPVIPDKKAKPKRLYIILGAILLAFVISYSFFFIKRYFHYIEIEKG